MRGWILYKETATQLKPEWYEIERLLAAAKADNIELSCQILLFLEWVLVPPILRWRLFVI